VADGLARDALLTETGERRAQREGVGKPAGELT
jgi:hypothetical protein